MSLFQAEYSFLSAESPGWGKIALLPWDEEIFGFPVADLQLGPDQPPAEHLHLFKEALEKFSAKTNAQLVSAHARGDDMASMAFIEKAGFSLVDFSLLATTSRFKTALLSSSGSALRQASENDHESIFNIAGNASDSVDIIQTLCFPGILQMPDTCAGCITP